LKCRIGEIGKGKKKNFVVEYDVNAMTEENWLTEGPGSTKKRGFNNADQ